MPRRSADDPGSAKNGDLGVGIADIAHHLLGVLADRGACAAKHDRDIAEAPKRAGLLDRAVERLLERGNEVERTVERIVEKFDRGRPLAGAMLLVRG